MIEKKYKSISAEDKDTYKKKKKKIQKKKRTKIDKTRVEKTKYGLSLIPLCYHIIIIIK